MIDDGEFVFLFYLKNNTSGFMTQKSDRPEKGPMKYFTLLTTILRLSD